MTQRLLSFFCLLVFLVPAFSGAGANSAKVSAEAPSRVPEPIQTVSLQFVDAATGYAVHPDSVIIRGNGEIVRPAPATDGRTALTLPAGAHTISVSAAHYRPFAASIAAGDSPRRHRFLLEPIAGPEQLTPEAIRSLHRPDAMVFLGFVADDATGAPLRGVRVRSFPSGVETITGDDGFFRLHVPLPSRVEMERAAPSLLFKKNSYEAHEYRNIEVWPNGDWTYRVRMNRGTGARTIDEDDLRRRPAVRYFLDESGNAVEWIGERPAQPVETEPLREGPAFQDDEPIAQAAEKLADSELPVRIPTNVRVLLDDNVTIEYVPMELYVRRSLPREWIASWANHTGGHHSLRAGAVAIRTYAIGFVNHPRGNDHDICATTACQVYGSTTHSHTDAAVAATTHYVMIDDAGRITLRMTEYSAENNSLGFACGDGYTQPADGCLFDPVCTGEERWGHGRGMCQWGSVRWATGLRFPGRTNDGSTHNYPTKDWIGISTHYYPHLTLTQGAQLDIGDHVRPTTTDLAVRLCPGGGIENGINCPQIAAISPGSTGVIVEGPILATADGRGHTWWKIAWDDGGETTGWSAENWLEHAEPPPPPPAPVLDPIPDRTVDEGALLTFTATATPTEREWLLTDFEGYSTGSNGSVLFRQPSFSGSTSGLLAASPNVSTVTDTLPPGNESTRALHAAWNWSSSTNPWLRLTTSNTANLPNPVIDFTRRFRFRIHTDRPLGVALGLRETDTAAGTPIGANGGSEGDIEFVGAASKSGAAPNPTRTVAAGSWTTLEFDIPNEPVVPFTGNGALSTPSGLGVLEHLAFVPADGIGEYNVHLDDFAVFEPRSLTFSLDPGAPHGAAIDPATGVFSWVPGEAQGPGVYTITIRVTDDASPPQSDMETFEVTVNEINHPPVLDPIPDRSVHAGGAVAFQAIATDPDIPENELTFSLDPGAPDEAVIDAGSGEFFWTTTAADAGHVFEITVRVTDDGSPPLGDTETFAVTVFDPLRAQIASGENGDLLITWHAIEGGVYRIQYKSDLRDPEWIDIQPDLTAEGPVLSGTVPRDSSRKFFRVLLVGP